MAMTIHHNPISIVDYRWPDETYKLYDVNFYNDQIRTLVTHNPSMVNSWIAETERIHGAGLCYSGVGMDVEWRPNFYRGVENPVATLQLCVGRRCLIFQLIHAPYIPRPLFHFLGRKFYTFVGVGIRSDVEKLLRHYNLDVSYYVDLGELVAYHMNNRQLENAGLKTLARHVLGKEVEKPRNVTMSTWDNQRLTAAQVQYACLDAFMSIEIRGRFPDF